MGLIEEFDAAVEAAKQEMIRDHMAWFAREVCGESLQPHDPDTPEVEPVEPPTTPATTGRVDDDAGDRERQARQSAKGQGKPEMVEVELPWADI